MSTLAKKLYATVCATAAMEQLVGSVDSSGDVFEEPEVQAGPGEIDSKEFVADVDAVERVTQLVTAAAAAQTADQVVQETTEVREIADQLRDGVTTLNEAAGGASMESFPFIQITADRLAARVGLSSLSLGVGLEAFSDGKRVLVSTAALEALISTLDASSATLLRSSQDRIVEMIQAIREALPDARDRLMTLLSDLELTTTDLSGRININPAVLSALSVDGSIPEDLVTYFSTYATYGKTLTCDYSRRASTSAEQASGLMGALNYTNPQAFWDSLAAAIDKIGDPRSALTNDAMSLALPGSGALFEASDAAVPDGNPTFQRLAGFILANKPAVSTDSEAEEQIDEVPSEDGTVGESTTGTVDSLSREQIRVIAKALLDTACPDAIDAALKAVEKNWNTSQAALAETRDTIRSFGGDVGQGLGIQLDMIPRYVETLHRLSVWPQINFITNLIFTANAFVLLGSEMVNGDRVQEEAPVDNITGDPSLDDPAATDAMADPSQDPESDPVSDSGIIDSSLDPAAATDTSSTELPATDPAAEPASTDAPAEPAAPEATSEPAADETGAGEGGEDAPAGDDAAGDAGTVTGAPEGEPAAAATDVPGDVASNPDEEGDEDEVPPLTPAP